MRLLLFALIFSSTLLCGQDSTLVIGLKNTPPFVSQSEGPRPTGLSLDFWELIDEQIPARAEYRSYDDLESMLGDLARGEIDLSINPVTVTEGRMDSLAFSQPYFISATAIARKQENNLLILLKNIFSKDFFSALAALLAVIFVFGFLVWLFERRKENEQFQRSWKGIFDGFWWSAVTMTTVGYGDKAPQTGGGRFVGFIWMFAAILLISGLTASIASSLTVQSIESKVEGLESLRRFECATIAGSSTEAYFTQHGLSSRAFEAVEEALAAVQAGEVDLFIYDRPVIEHYLSEGNFPEVVLEAKDLKTDYYSFSYPKGSPLKEALDPKIVGALKSKAWHYRLKEHRSE